MIARVALSFIIISLLVPFAIIGCSKSGNSREDNNMFTQAKIPAIDTRLPTKIETATFALG